MIPSFVTHAHVLVLGVAFYIPGSPIMPRTAGTNLGTKYTAYIPVNAVKSPVN